ncbi:hypothetical protein, partial [Stutzerimonas nitrititolerans]
APGATVERTNPARSAGPDAGARLFGSFWGDCQKELAQQGETRATKQPDNAYESATFIQPTKIASPAKAR